MAAGFLIALEGVDGSGKTTQARLLAAALEKRDGKVVLTQEPTTGVIGQKLRHYLQGPTRHMTAEEELHLFIADRRQHVEEIINPALGAEKIVICDRFYYSSAAYQGALGLDPLRIIATNESFAPRPDLVFLLEMAVPAALQRLSRQGKEGRQLSEFPSYLQAVALIYAGLKGPQFRRVDAGLPREMVHGLILKETLTGLSKAGWTL